MAEAAAGILYGVRTVVESAALVAKGIYDPTLPLKATLTPLTSISVPKAEHTVSVIKGRAYLFGGVSNADGEGELAENDVHVILLPTSGMESEDYLRLAAGEGSPPKRRGHVAAAIDEQIFFFGGIGADGRPLDEGGRVWTFDTVSNSWSHMDPPPEGDKPAPRSQAAAVGTVHPQPVAKRTDEGSLPQDPPDPAKIVPEPPSAGSYGTLIIQGGVGADGTPLNDLWAFDISSRTWSQLPSPPVSDSAAQAPGQALVGNRLYSFLEGRTWYLDLSPSFFDDRAGAGELGIAPLGPWGEVSRPGIEGSEDGGSREGEAEAPLVQQHSSSHPGPRAAAPMFPITTGQGRNYLLLLGGQTANTTPSPASPSTIHEDILTLQLPPSPNSAASLKDAARQAIKKDTLEAVWEEVKYHDAEGRMIQEGQEGRGVGVRRGAGVGMVYGLDGSSVLVWGGVGEGREVRRGGVVVSVGV